MAVKLAMLPSAEGAAHNASNPKYRNKLKLDLSEAIKLSGQLHKTVTRAMPDDLPYALENAASQYKDGFAELLATIDNCDVTDDPFILGYTYQYWRDCDRKDAQSGIQSADKHIDKDRLIAFTQIYTPEWVVSFIIENTLGAPASRRLFERSRQDAGSPGPITILDPACGAGNFLLGAFDELFRLHQGNGNSAKKSVEFIFEKQLHGCDIDAVALSVAATALIVRCMQLGLQTVPRLNGLALSVPADEALLGSLSKNFPEKHPLSKKHDFVVTNPPYIGRKLISRELKTLIKSRFPNSHHDLSAAFFERCLTLLKPSGRVGLITQASVMFLPSHSKLRELILDEYQLIAAVDAGPGVFPLQGGEKVNSAILVVENTTSGTTGKTARFYRLKQAEAKAGNADILSTFPASEPMLIDPARFKHFHGSAFNYFVPPAVADVVKHSEPLSSIADIRQGLATTDNDRFVKLIWQVSKEELGRIWFPYAKGAGGHRFYSPVKHVVNWHDNGAAIKQAVDDRYPYLKGKTAWVVKNESFYFQPGLCFSFVNTRGIAVRKLPADCIFDVGASAIFSDVDDYLLAYLNSSFMVALANSLNPTINYQVGDLKRFPVMKCSVETVAKLSALARECLEAKKEITELVDPGAWFDPFSGMPSSHRLYHSVGENGFTAAFPQFAARLEKLESQIRACEFEIDELVLDTLSSLYSWSSPTKNEVLRWIEEYATRATTSTRQNLAQLFLDNFLVHAFLSPAVGTAPELPFADADDRAAAENLLGTSLCNYQGSLQARINKRFLGFPPESLRSIHLTDIVS